MRTAPGQSQNLIDCRVLLSNTLLIFLLLFLWPSTPVRAQQAGAPLLDVAHIRFVDSMNAISFLVTAPKNSVNRENIPLLPFPDTPVLQKSVPSYMIEKDCFLKFTLSNSANTTRELFFLPAFYLKSLAVYKSFEGKLIEISQAGNALHNARFPGAILLSVGPRDTVTFYAKFQYVRTNINNYMPRLIEKDYVREFKAGMKSKDEMLDRITFIASGILLLMIFYSFAVYVQSRNKEFMFYSIYTFCTGILLFLKSYFDQDNVQFHFFYEEYLDFMILCIGVFFYLYFLRSFLDTKNNYAFIDRFLRISAVVLLGLLAIYSMIYFLTEKYIVLNLMENYVIKLFLFGIGIVFIVYSIRKNHRLLNFLAYGNFALLSFSILSFGIILFKWKFVGESSSILNRAMFYYIIGLVLELLLFLFGLAYKNKRDTIESAKESERLKLDNERKELEKQVAVITAQQQERDRISADMHDELGSGVTAIRLMSEIAKNKMKGTSFPEIDKISHSANELLGKMDTIIWTMKSSNDTVESLAAYTREYAMGYFDGTAVTCNVQVGNFPLITISGEKRRNIFLGIKESLNNIIKHSQATVVKITIQVEDKVLLINIEDNGIGMEKENLRRFGNGLQNIKRRMENVQGTFDIVNSGGTKLIFRLPV